MQKAVLLNKTNMQEIVTALKNGQIGMVPSDTLYGLSCCATNKDAVEKTYIIKNRDYSKPFIVLIDSIETISNFEVTLTTQQRTFLENNWPNKLTVVLECPSEKFSYIHRGKNSIGFRLPNDTWLQSIIKETGPLISTTVNLSGEPAIYSVPEAIEVFGDTIDFYVEVGEIESPPSTVISLANNGSFEILRQGSVIVNANKN